MYLSPPKIRITQTVARSILDKNKPLCITEWNKTELLWKQILQQNFSEVDGLQLCSQSPWAPIYSSLSLGVLREKVWETHLWVHLKPRTQMMYASHGAYPFGINIYQGTSLQTPYQTCDGFTAVTASVLTSLSFSLLLNRLISISGWVFTYLHTAHQLWKKLTLHQS